MQPLDLVRVDFTSIETTMELNQLTEVSKMSSFWYGSFHKICTMAFVTKDQKAKTDVHEFSMSDSSRCLVCTC